MAHTFKGWIGKDLDEHGMAWAILVRERDGGRCELGAFLVDAWCLGVKDAYYDEIPADEIQSFLNEQLPADTREEVPPACVRALVEGAVAYAQSLGFLPHRDYRKARKVFGSLKSTDCSRTFTFGREGRACFMPGPDDDDARINRVLAVLTARLGADGFDFSDPADTRVDALFRFIEAGRCPDKGLTSFGAAGFITGLWIQPDLIQPEEWQPAFWGGATALPEFRDAAEAGEVTEALHVLYDETRVEMDEDEYLVGLPPADDPACAASAAQYSAGVLRSLGLRPKVLSWLRTHPEGAPAIALLERCGRGEEPAGENLEDDLANAVLALRDLGAELTRRDPPTA